MPGLGRVAFGVAAGVATLAGAPVALGALGFGSAGVVAGSIAAGIQGPAVVSGSYFALAQSAGAAGLAVGTQAALFVGGAIAGVLGSL
ncbi:interferon alpha-inducible protein 27-like protein 2A [Mya arenaria]|uniref:interferon alpha-inducible protein 27-like protein 2A n=1 Tax=Mya arenaria TaxID=6604 RepID=UPI0022E86696|nr:interferon alpha-inducible protein 27-like protein 2A [Mya arenaria]